ncbi:pirin family protein [Hymenobacter jeollabukensis]|uniref:Quercetin 2,3-dioxygenase C-terminal cupin domain-containing protein n=1 Tax=Hymenobacter jeollabukensis TaxID=2025313 RepID=A0A5R8WN19_9BACT|nr:hypothetical protein [Hymenobacter jeollabukensis]TLM91026.1 hypothetical protein FDY95_15605 [Hymenobacter jeollabukensis]
MKQTPGKIFLGEQRGLTETAQFRRYSTLSFGPYADAHKGPVGRLRALNDELLAGGQQVSLRAETAALLLVLPITGAVRVSTPQHDPAPVDAGEALLLPLAADAEVHFQNPYPADVISFLHLWLDTATPLTAPQRFTFAPEALDNQLATIVAADARLDFTLQLGRFAGRHEAVCRLAEGARLFAFVVAGAFELEGRLLHEKDALALWGTAEVELEALSNDALVLLLTV